MLAKHCITVRDIMEHKEIMCNCFYRNIDLDGCEIMMKMETATYNEEILHSLHLYSIKTYRTALSVLKNIRLAMHDLSDRVFIFQMDQNNIDNGQGTHLILFSSDIFDDLNVDILNDDEVYFIGAIQNMIGVINDRYQ